MPKNSGEMSKMNKKIAVITPIFYHPSVLDKFLNKMKQQKQIEYFTIYLINDCSPYTDEYPSIIQKYQNFLNIVYLKTKQNNGPGMARQLGIDNCKEDYIFFLDEDDYLYPNNFFEILKLYLDKQDYHIIETSKTWIEIKNNKIVEQRGDSRELFDPIGTVINRSFLQKYNIRFNENCSWYFENTYLLNIINFYLNKESSVSFLYHPNLYYMIYHTDQLDTLTYKKNLFNNSYYIQYEIIYIATILDFYEKHKNELIKEDVQFIRQVLSNYFSGSGYILSFIEIYGFNPKFNKKQIQLLYDKWIYLINLINKNQTILWKTGVFNYLEPYLKNKVFSLNNSWEYFCQTFEERFNKIRNG